jgi:hypothetical protein
MRNKISFQSSLIILFSCLIGFINSVIADYHYVSHSGSDTYPYTSWETAAENRIATAPTGISR